MLATLALFPAIARAAFGNSTAVDCGVRGILYGVAHRRAPRTATQPFDKVLRDALNFDWCASKGFPPPASPPAGAAAPPPAVDATHPDDTVLHVAPPCYHDHTVAWCVTDTATPAADGSAARPFASVHAAAAAAAAVPPPHRVHILLRGGRHPVDRQPLTLARPNVTVRAEGGDAVAAVLDGGVTVTLASPWAPAPAPFPKGVMAARVAPGRFPTDVTGAGGLPQSLYVDGARYVRARDPNGVPWTTGGPCFNDPRHAGEGCDAWYAQVGKGLSMFHTNVTRHRTARTDRRYGMYTEYSVYDFDAPFHDPAFPPSYAFLGSNYHRINAITEPAALKPRIAAWPLTNHTVVHAFHGKLWGSWQYTMAGGGVREGVIHFGRGGWQEAQDATDAETMGHWYIDGWAAALDIPGEWWFEGDTLYVFPNSTGALPHSVVVAASDSVVHVRANGVHVANVSVTRAAATYLQYYEVPSGGDWSVHRGAAIDIANATGASVVGCDVYDCDGNALIVGMHTRFTNVTDNVFMRTGDSHVVVMGKSPDYKATAGRGEAADTMVARNFMGWNGLTGKQSSCVFHAVAPRTSIIDNVCYNGPRAGINANDAYFGDNTVRGNVVFAQVQETQDHGPYNSWDRQPFLVDGTAVPRETIISDNFFISEYSPFTSPDHDDGSEFFTDTANVAVYAGCKNFKGNNKTCANSVIVSTDWCLTLNGVTADGGYYVNNTCHTTTGRMYKGTSCKVNAAGTGLVSDSMYITRGNTFYVENGSPATNVLCGTDVIPIETWQGKLGQDKGSRAVPLRTPEAIVPIVKNFVDHWEYRQ